MAMPAVDTAGYTFAQTAGALVIARPAAPLTYSDGLPAKRAAMAYCAGQGGQLNPTALGRYGAAVWQFDGGCK